MITHGTSIKIFTDIPPCYTHYYKIILATLLSYYRNSFMQYS
jgi:hypothetical protein